ncbi:glycosyltransferase [Paenibacillus abyssi]|uniref:glycosyltransferase n=1 Tax=Paenibacillus abyssi TaxID=1340531 RepID=UPI00166A3EBA|nr:glycosyltransferase [Paenibacillus abyssi]
MFKSMKGATEMITVSYYISDYGYGHAARSIAVIRSLLQFSGNRLRIIICCSKALSFIKESLKEYDQEIIEYRNVSTDLGYILKQGSIQPDIDRLTVEYLKYIEGFPQLVERECKFLRQENISLVISDISPIPFAAANAVNIKSVGISNFTWYTAYTQMLEEHLLTPIKEAYSQMDYFVSLPGADEPYWGRYGHLRAGFFCREPLEKDLEQLSYQLNLNGSKIVVFFALGMSIGVDDLKGMQMWEDDSCLFIVSSNMDIDHKNVIRIPEHYTESQHYVALSDIVISKPGWGTVSEAVSLGKPLLLLKRDSFVEDDNTVAALNDNHPYKQIEWEQLKHLSITRELVESLNSRTTKQAANRRNENLQKIVEFAAELTVERQVIKTGW